MKRGRLLPRHKPFEASKDSQVDLTVEARERVQRLTETVLDEVIDADVGQVLDCARAFRPTQPTRRSPSQKVKGSNDPELPANRLFFSRVSCRLAAGPVSVRREADAPADCTDEKGLQMQAFSEAAEGIRTLDLLHGKQNVWFRLGADIPCKSGGCRVLVSPLEFPGFPREFTGFQAPNGHPDRRGFGRSGSRCAVLLSLVRSFGQGRGLGQAPPPPEGYQGTGMKQLRHRSRVLLIA